MTKLFFIIKLALVHIKFYINAIVPVVCLCYFFFLYLLLGEYFYKAVEFIAERSCHLVVYLKEETTSDDIENLQQWIAKFPNVKGVNFVSSKEAFNQLTRELKIDLTKIISQEDLSASFEIYLGGGLRSFDHTTQLFSELSRCPHIREIVYDKRLINFLKTTTATAESIYRGGGVILSLLLFYLLMYIFRFNIRRHQSEFYLLKLHGTNPSVVSLSNAIASGLIFLVCWAVALLCLFFTQYFIMINIDIANIKFFLQQKVILRYLCVGVVGSSVIGGYLGIQSVRR